ncbi:MAG: nucleotidyltransferase family protein [Thermoguttaceae bacterium]|nr:nucleotidyltransferase family protein [Thermoguttaceae bacterium]
MSPESSSSAKSLGIEERFLLDVVGACLKEEELPNPPDNFSEDEFAKLARAHRVAPLIGYAVRDRGARGFSSALRAKLDLELTVAVAIETRQSSEIAKIDERFKAAKIRFLPLKGRVAREFYKEPFLRPMNDYDVLIDETDAEKVANVLTQLGYVPVSSELQGFRKDNWFEVDLHFNSPLQEGARGAGPNFWSARIPLDDFEYRFSKEDFYRYMIEHFAKHWKRGGALLRDYCDIAIYSRKFGGELDREKLDSELERYGLARFVRNLERLVDSMFFGGETDPLLDELTRYAFGRLDEKDESRKALKIAAIGSEIPQNASFRWARVVASRVFPRAAKMHFARRVQALPPALRITKKIALWIGYWARRLFRVGFFKNAFALLAGNRRAENEIEAFYRRAGLP